MPRLCERPGCSAPAAVAYGMDSEHLLVWLALVPEEVSPIRVGMLCRRHADAMVVPRGWTLDDRREAKPRLFRVADAPTTNHPSRSRKARAKAADRTDRSDQVEPIERPLQLDFDAVAEPVLEPGLESGLERELERRLEPGLEPVLELTPSDPEADVTVAEIVAPQRDADETQAMPWRPVFDHSDDLDGLLKASSPLLSRAFRGRDAKPPRPS